MDRRKFIRNSFALATTFSIGLESFYPTAYAQAGGNIDPMMTLPPGLKSDPFAKLDATAQALLIKQNKVSPLELTEAAIKRIELLNPSINAVVHTMFGEAKRYAKSNEIPNGPFRGVPYLIKDLSDLEGQPLEFGSKLFKGFKAFRDLGAVKRAKEAGVIILGKTNTPEFGLMATTESLLYGPARNPWNLSRHTGGSSGGAAAAVASGMVPFAHASDGGGSIRIPASACGLVGLKPSRDRLYRVAMEDNFLSTDIICRFGLSRSVRDTARLLDVSEIKKGGKFKPVGYVSGPSKKRLKIAYSTRDLLGTDSHPEVKQAIEQTAALCASLGHELVEAHVDVDSEEFAHNFLIVWSHMAYTLTKYSRLLGMTQFKWISADEALEPFTRGLSEWYSTQASKKPDALEQSTKYFEKMAIIHDQYFEKFDLELTPTLSTPPIPIGEQAPTLDFDVLIERMMEYVSYTPPHNATGVPAITLPLYQSKDGLPIGSQFASGRGKEGTLLALAYELEQALPWEGRYAPFSAFV